EALHPLTGPNMGPSSVQGSSQISRVISLQGNSTNTILVRLSSTSLAINNEVPEPATIVMLVSGLGFMTGVLKKKPKDARR
ncbi:MAG TPA: PEP-CTERM sorting domain-containing protein, partial [Pyrinomonadaceae bacterium]|nr:PEP-CTERM sorting domain-containing protein [Pyrinomonadaceae bacterium]